jgi:hypothetical protein
MHGKDFLLIPLLRSPVSWGPEPSRSAGGTPTTYTAQFFALVFKTDPVQALRKLSSSEFALVPVRLVEAGYKPEIANTIRILRKTAGDLQRIPFAWPDTIASSLVGLTRYTPEASRPDMGRRDGSSTI